MKLSYPGKKRPTSKKWEELRRRICTGEPLPYRKVEMVRRISYPKKPVKKTIHVLIVPGTRHSRA